MSDFVPPHAAESEKIVLGAAMTHPNAASGAARLLQPADFYVARHALVFQAIADAVAHGTPTDPVAIAERLTVSGDLTRAGGAPYLHDLIASVPVAAQLPYHARIVAWYADKRRLIEAGHRIAHLAMTPDADPADVAAMSTKLISDAITNRDTTGPTHIGSLLNPALDRVEANAKSKANPGLETGLIELDKLTGGLRPGNLVLIAGRPGMGKSMLALQIAAHAALRQGKAAAVFSLEMTSDELIYRLISAETGIDLSDINKNWLTSREWERIAQKSGTISEAPLYLDDTASLNIAQLVDRARRVHSRTPLAVVVVDYLQLLKPIMRNGSVSNREREVAEMSRGLKEMAKDLGIPVVAAAQLNRNVEMRSDKVPTMADLRESGQLENDADVAILLHRPAYYDPKTPRGNEIDLVIGKNRHGPMNVTLLANAEFQYSRITDKLARAIHAASSAATH